MEKIDKIAKDLLQEITDLERLHLGRINRRLELMEELAKVDKEEGEFQRQIHIKKQELRKLWMDQTTSSSPQTPSPSTFSARASQDGTGSVRGRRPPLSGSTRTFSINFKNAQQVKKELEEERVALDKAILDKKSPKKPKTKPKYLDAIEPEDASLYSPKMLAVVSAKMFDMMPKLKCEDLKDKRCLTTIDGPNLSSQNNFSSVSPPPAEAYHDFACAKTISTYPIAFTKDTREGDPICDRFCIDLWSNRALVVLGDGCNWGPRPRDAALKATEGFSAYMKEEQNYKDVKEAGSCLLKAVAAAHNKIIEGKDDVWEAGTTTLLGGMLVELKKSDDFPEFQHAFICASVGDCKAFCWTPSSGKLLDITVGNRTNLTDASDPGGRIGPYLQGGTPDLRNLDLYFHPCSKGDIILVCSDGIHDNLDPQQLGKTPKEFGIDADTWKEAESTFPEDTEEAKTNFRNKFLASELGEIARKNKNFTLIDVCQHLLQYCWYLTKKGREFMETTPGKKLPSDYSQYPGKMDHTTVVALRVGTYI